MTPDSLRQRFREHAGPLDDGELDQIARAALRGLAVVVPVGDRAALAEPLPEGLREALAGPYRGPDLDEAAVFAPVVEATGADVGRARELASAFYRALGVALDSDTRARIRRHLPDAIAAHFEPGPAGAGHAGPAGVVTRPPQSGSVAAWDGDSAARTLGSYGGDAREERGETLATGVPGSRRKLSEPE